jgi:hypothetical protein
MRAMASEFEPTDIHCDAPPYSVVRACQKLGFRAPLDVRWHRMSHFLHERANSLAAASLPWKILFGPGEEAIQACTCGHPLPVLEKYAFTFISERQAEYLLGQCSRCRTIFWDEG